MPRPRFRSSSYEATKARWIRGAKSRSCAELAHAFECGELSLRQYDILSRRSKTQQKRIVAREQDAKTAALIAARAIEAFLDNAPSELRLSEVVGVIQRALA